MAVIDLGSYSIKTLGGKNSAREFVTPDNTIGGTFTLPIADADRLSETLKAVRRETRISSAQVLIPDQWARQLFVTVKDVPPEYSSDYIVWRAKDQIRDEVHSGSKICSHVTRAEKGQDGKYVVDAYLCLVKLDILNRVSDIFKSCDIDIRSIDTTSHAIYNYLSSTGKLEPDFAVLNVGYEVTTVYFYSGYEPVYVRIIETAGKDYVNEIAGRASSGGEGGDAPAASREQMTEKLVSEKIFPGALDPSLLEEFEKNEHRTTDKFLKEIHLTFEFFYSKFPRAALSCAYLSGGICHLPGIEFFLANFLGVPAKLAIEEKMVHFTPLFGAGE